MKRRILSGSLLMIFALATTGLLFAPNDGCTPGFWKNHPERWVGFSPTETLGAIFDMTDFPSMANIELMDALKFNGGPGVEGAARIFLRSAVAGLLNYAHPSVHWLGLYIVGMAFDIEYWEVTLADVMLFVNQALASSDRDVLLNFKDQLDGVNNRICTVIQ